MDRKRTRSVSELEEDVQCVGFQPMVVQPRTEQVNPISIIMSSSARSCRSDCAAGTQAPGGACTLHTETQVPCTHCGQRLPETHLEQCVQCCDTFCAQCCVTNYDAHEDRTFCFDCSIETGNLGAPLQASSWSSSSSTTTSLGNGLSGFGTSKGAAPPPPSMPAKGFFDMAMWCGLSNSFAAGQAMQAL